MGASPMRSRRPAACSDSAAGAASCMGEAPMPREASRRLRQELLELLRKLLDAAADRLVHGVLHREPHPPLDARVRLDAQLAHLADRPCPGVVFLLAAPLVAVEPDHVVANLVEKDGEADRRARDGRLDPVDDPAVVVVHAPRAAAHGATPLADADVVALFHIGDELGVIGHGHGFYRPLWVLRSHRAAVRLTMRNRCPRRSTTWMRRDSRGPCCWYCCCRWGYRSRRSCGRFGAGRRTAVGARYWTGRASAGGSCRARRTRRASRSTASRGRA